MLARLPAASVAASQEQAAFRDSADPLASSAARSAPSVLRASGDARLSQAQALARADCCHSAQC